MEWQPIETAPKDEPVIVFCNGHHIFTAGQIDGIWYWGILINDSVKISVKLIPTHWMPLPKPPEE